MTFNPDMTSAPRGKTVQAQRVVNDKSSASGKCLKTVDEYQRDDVILASKCGKVIKSYWIPEENRFAGFQPGEEIIGWMAWPTHPYFIGEPRSAPERDQADIKPQARTDAGETAAHHFHLEDCGSGA